MAKKGSQTEKSLIEAFKREAQAALIFEHAAFRAELDGHNDLAQKFYQSAGIRRSQAKANLHLLQTNPITGESTTISRKNIQSAIDASTILFHDVYPELADAARDEGQNEVAVWLETLAKVERREAKLYQDALMALID